MADLPQLPSPADYDYTGESGQAPADNKESVFEGILETLQQNNFVLNEVSESADIIEENTAHDESETERRNRRINEENTDKKEKKDKKNGLFSKAMGGLGGILNKANPFQEGGLGTKMSILLISGVLFAISKFGDKLVKPLAEVLEMFDGEGGVLEKLKNSEMFKGVVETFEKIIEDIKGRFETIGADIKTGFDDAVATFNEISTTISSMGVNIESLLAAVTTAVGFVKGAYDSVMAYINSFDTQGSGPRNEYSDGKIDAFELQNLKDDLMKKAQDLVTSIIGTVWNEISFATKLMFAAGGAVSILLQGALVARVAKMIAGVSGKTPPGGDTKPSDAKDNFKSKSKISKILTKAASAFTISSGATASSVGGASAAASAAQGTRLNSAGRLINSQTGRYVAQFGGKSFSLLHLAKYPTALKLVQRLPFLAPIFGGLQALALFNDPNATHDDKIEGLGRIIGGVGGAAIFGKIGAALGALGAVPTGGLSILAGGLVGATGGYFAGEYMGGKLAQYILGEEPEFPKFNFGDSNLGSTLNTSTGTVENLPIQTMSGTSGYETNAGVNDQYYDGEVPKMSMVPSSNDHRNFSQANAVSQLQGNLMNRNTDLALAAYEADKAKKLSNTSLNPLPGGRGDGPISMPVVVDKGQVTNIQSNYGSTLSVDNGNRTSRLFTDSLLIDVRSAYAGQ